MSSEENKATGQPSTIQSYVESAVGTVESVIGSITGNTADQKKGEEHKTDAQIEHDASHAAVKAGSYTLSSSGAVAKDSADRSNGSWNQTLGSGKEMLGNLIGSEKLKQDGIQQNKDGKLQEAQGQLSDLGAGVTDRIKGAAGGALAGLTGDAEEQQKRLAQHDVGKSLQRGVEHDLQKQADAQKKDVE